MCELFYFRAQAVEWTRIAVQQLYLSCCKHLMRVHQEESHAGNTAIPRPVMAEGAFSRALRDSKEAQGIRASDSIQRSASMGPSCAPVCLSNEVKKICHMGILYLENYYEVVGLGAASWCDSRAHS